MNVLCLICIESANEMAENLKNPNFCEPALLWSWTVVSSRPRALPTEPEQASLGQLAFVQASFDQLVSYSYEFWFFKFLVKFMLRVFTCC